MVSTPNAMDQPCEVCGRETRPGSPLFSDRHSTIDPAGIATYRCADCSDRAVSHAARNEPIDTVQRSARAAGLGMGGGGSIGSGGGSG